MLYFHVFQFLLQSLLTLKV